METIAVPTAAPIWNIVLFSPDASPASRSSMPASAAIEQVTKVRPTPGPLINSPRKMSPK